VGSVIGLHGLTEERMHETVDWNCYRIIGANIYQWPAVQISLGLYTELKEIQFLGETFLVPNPPKDYLRQRYGSDWGQL
jgi:phosphorylcholine metabolism protein LicD